MTPYIRALIRKVGRPRLVALLTITTCLLALAIKYSFTPFFGAFPLLEELVFIVTASCIIAPLLSWYLLGLLFELDELEMQLKTLAT